MSKIDATVNEAQLKGRRTSLGKKSKEELINIILRKDKTERSNNNKIQTLQNEVQNLTKECGEKQTTIEELRNKCNDTYSRFKTEQESNEVARLKIKSLDKTIISSDKEIYRLKAKANTLQKTVWALFGAFIIIGAISFIF